MPISFEDAHFPKEIILTCFRWYVAYPLITRNLEERMLERQMSVNQFTINRWGIQDSPPLEAELHRRKRVLHAATDTTDRQRPIVETDLGSVRSSFVEIGWHEEAGVRELGRFERVLTVMPIPPHVNDHVVVNLLAQAHLKVVLRVRFDVANAVVFVFSGVTQEISEKDVLDRRGREQPVVGESNNRP